jgi:hypothetical protein
LGLKKPALFIGIMISCTYGTLTESWISDVGMNEPNILFFKTLKVQFGTSAFEIVQTNNGPFRIIFLEKNAYIAANKSSTACYQNGFLFHAASASC